MENETQNGKKIYLIICFLQPVFMIKQEEGAKAQIKFILYFIFICCYQKTGGAGISNFFVLCS